MERNRIVLFNSQWGVCNATMGRSISGRNGGRSDRSCFMAADRVNPDQLKRLMRSVQQAIERRDETHDRLAPAANPPLQHRAMCVAANRLVFGHEPQCTT
jgi:hypothetical protein